jgi:hypothetical protein
MEDNNKPSPTQELRSRAKLSVNPLFLKHPPQYYGYALQWVMYPKWTVEEAANLLFACVPHREMLLPGPANEQLDGEVLALENKIRRALGKELTIIKSKKYFSTLYVDHSDLITWAKKEHIPIPNDLLKAKLETEQNTKIYGYTTPCLEALNWVIENFWQQVDLREPPSTSIIVQSILGEFPNLSGEECDMIEYIARHPYARKMKG